MYFVHSRPLGNRFPSLGRCLQYLDGLTGRTGGKYRTCRARELEQAWRDGDICYRDACEELEELDAEP